MLVPRSVTVTFVSGIAAPLWSVTVPTMVPVSVSCACAHSAPKNRQSAADRTYFTQARVFLRIIYSSSKKGDTSTRRWDAIYSRTKPQGIVGFDGPNVKQFFEASSTGKVALAKWKFGRQSVRTS